MGQVKMLAANKQKYIIETNRASLLIALSSYEGSGEPAQMNILPRAFMDVIRKVWM